ncbi:MAG: hypothetical protein KGD60_04835 [Candidatus Thorarchaeota archaeon]|nr:hypothetical protein [Candidatus Thorarchaeota archaeon]
MHEVSGTDLQINVIDTKPSNDAQRNPDSYATLMFRISGYNAFFTKVVRELQEELITKTEHSL